MMMHVVQLFSSIGTGTEAYVTLNRLHPRSHEAEQYTIQAPEICSLYTLSVSPQFVRQAIRRRFEDNRYVTDLPIIDRLLLRSRQEYQETMNQWKQKDHVMGKLLIRRDRPQKTFLQKFYEGAFRYIKVCKLVNLTSIQGGTRTKCCQRRQAFFKMYLDVYPNAFIVNFHSFRLSCAVNAWVALSIGRRTTSVSACLPCTRHYAWDQTTSRAFL